MSALAGIAHPVTIVAAADGDARSCSTGTTMYLSLDPPLLAVSQLPGGTTTGLIERSGELSVSLLAATQVDLAGRAARRATSSDKFAEVGIAALAPPDGRAAPGVAGSLAVLWCDVVDTHPAGDHVLFVCRVVADVAAELDPPLLRHRRRYRAGGEWLSGESPEGFPI
jgi:flavin reductase (DIM6/NTAB) family NADH-FMN oxidoreductase RutF